MRSAPTTISERTSICVTGLGAITPLGNSVRELWDGLLAGRSGIRPLANVDTADLPCPIGGEVRNPPVEVIAEHAKLDRHRMDRASLFAVLAAREALLHAGWPLHDLGPRAAVVFGAGLSGMLTLQQQTERLLGKGPRAVSPLTIPLLMPNAAVANICLAFDARGPSQTVSTACSSSGHALLDAVRMLRCRDADLVIAGGTEASLTRLGISSFVRMGAMAKYDGSPPETLVRPFDARRNGLIMSEGAAALVLERTDDALAAGRRPLALLLGGCATTDAFHLVTPDPDAVGAVAAVAGAIRDAGLTAGDIADRVYVNAHGTATPLNDLAETRALKGVFGDAARRLRISSTKSMTGHMIGAAGAVETVICVRALGDGRLPPTINLHEPDPDCDLDFIPNKPREAACEYAINNTFGFGGHNVSLLLARGH
ncbi:MAG: beta-ketoacyl-[acyl-carrier-protein] synthase family protein [Planctomyces sp.]|nr:beta-ketoacyl-[acyl-carrier-protein] synthase family protein [Planctomyces sp.]